MRRARVWVLLALIVGLGGCGGDRAADRRPDVFLIVVDALRADRISAPKPPAPPFLATLAESATVFHRAYAASSWTSSSIASLLTSRLPSRHGVVEFSSRLPDSEVTLAEVLARAGYRTAAFSGNLLISEWSGFAQGFEVFLNLGGWPADSTHAPKPRAKEIDAAALNWLDGVRQAGDPRPPVFVYLHYMETHTPYAPEPELREAVLSTRGRSAQQRERQVRLNTGGEDWTKFDAEGAQLLADLYDAELLSLDRELERFFAALRQRGFLTDAVVVLTADHGEEFLEHGRFGHGATLFEEVTRVPLLVQVPGAGTRRDASEVTSLLAVAPSITAIAAATQPASFAGSRLDLDRVAHWRTLVCNLVRWCDTPAVGISELLRLAVPPTGRPHHQRSLVEGDGKLITLSNDEALAFDLAADPREEHPGDASSGAVAALRETLATSVAASETPGAAPARAPFDDATRERLRALGYDAK